MADGKASRPAQRGSFEPLSLADIAASRRTGGPISAEVKLNAQAWAPFATMSAMSRRRSRDGHEGAALYCGAGVVAVHPSYVEADPGGVTQGVGWALNEEYIYDKDGRLGTRFLDYRIPVAPDMPMIDAVMVEVPNPRHPFGARGVGEVPIVPPMAAVANAIADAAGRRLRDLPMSPPKVLSALGEPAPKPQRMAAE